MLRKNDRRLATMLNKRVEVWRSEKSNLKNRLGQYPIEDKKVTTIYASVIPQTGTLLNGREADTTLTKTTHKIITRYRNDITSDMWFMYSGTRYNILYIMDANLDHERLEIFCEVVI